MANIGVICPPLNSHISCLAALGKELQKRNHQVIFFQIEDAANLVKTEGLNFCALGQSDYALGSLAEFKAKMGKLNGLSAMNFAFNTVKRANRMMCRDAPSALKKANIELLLVDQGEPIGGTIAEYLQIPFISICCGLPINREANVAPYFTPWQYQNNWIARWRNQLGYFVFDWLSRSISAELNQLRKQWHLPIYNHPDAVFSPWAQISQTSAEFDFPRSQLPNCFHYIGSFRSHIKGEQVPFPYENLTDKPLIYASMGTLQNRQQEVFVEIASACEGLDVQLVISLGGGSQVKDYQSLPGNPLVVGYAPQIKLLSQAKLAIAHAGLNSTLESLIQGVPLVAIPVTGDQLGVAARVSWTKTGIVIPVEKLSATKLRRQVKEVLNNNSYRQQAKMIGDSILQAGGVVKAANIVEQVIERKKPILSCQSTL